MTTNVTDQVCKTSIHTGPGLVTEPLPRFMNMSSRRQGTSSSRCLDDKWVTSVVLVLCWILPLCLGQKDALRMVTFRKPLICPSQVPVENQTTVAVTSRSKVNCAVACLSSPLCQSIVYEPDSKTCHLSQFVVAENCPGTEDSKNRKMFLQKTSGCINGGILRNSLCECIPGYVGENCELGPMRDCGDYLKMGQLLQNDVRVVRPTASVFFSVFCFTSGLLTTMLRASNKVNFTRPWREYRDGFGSLSDTHWLGLEKMHILTSQDRNYQLRIQVTLSNGTQLNTYYNNFTVSDEDHFYQMDYTHMENTSSPVGDCLSDLRGANFSTYDSDNDGDSRVNCASRHSGGWWFRGNTCSTCNPTGQLLQPANGRRTGVDTEVFWIKDLGDVVPVRIRLSLSNM